jgi:hypothetical protein
VGPSQNGFVVESFIDELNRHCHVLTQRLGEGGHSLGLDALLTPQRQRQPDDDGPHSEPVNGEW